MHAADQECVLVKSLDFRYSSTHPAYQPTQQQAPATRTDPQVDLLGSIQSRKV
jgi:hypothetical protein